KGRVDGLLGELLGELAVGEVEGAVANEPAGGCVPERRRAAVPEHNLVSVGQAEQLGEPLANRADQVANRRLAMRGAHQVRSLGGPRARPGADLWRARGGGALGRVTARGDSGLFSWRGSWWWAGGRRFRALGGGPRHAGPRSHTMKTWPMRAEPKRSRARA